MNCKMHTHNKSRLSLPEVLAILHNPARAVSCDSERVGHRIVDDVVTEGDRCCVCSALDSNRR